MIHRTYRKTRIPQHLNHPESASNMKRINIHEGSICFLASELRDLPVKILKKGHLMGIRDPPYLLRNPNSATPQPLGI